MKRSQDIIDTLYEKKPSERLPLIFEWIKIKKMTRRQFEESINCFYNEKAEDEIC